MILLPFWTCPCREAFGDSRHIRISATTLEIPAGCIHSFFDSTCSRSVYFSDYSSCRRMLDFGRECSGAKCRVGQLLCPANFTVLNSPNFMSSIQHFAVCLVADSLNPGVVNAGNVFQDPGAAPTVSCPIPATTQQATCSSLNAENCRRHS